MVIDEEILNVIDPKVLETLSDEEKEVLISMLSEMANGGESTTLNNLWQQDYEEIPVDIDTFIEDDDYLGSATNNGKSIYPYWRERLREWFAPDAPYMEVILSGSIGIGKTTIADIGLAYLLYKLLCLKNPQEYYGLTKSSIMTVAFINVDMNLAYGVSYAKFQSFLMNSPWFLRHGSVAGIKNQVYIPSKGIEFRIGSSDKNVLGSDVFCLTGDTKVNSVEHGITTLNQLTGEVVTFYQVAEDGTITVSNPCSVVPTKRVSELVELTLEDGTVVRLTPDHRLRLINNSYKKAVEINEGDELMEI